MLLKLLHWVQSKINIDHKHKQSLKVGCIDQPFVAFKKLCLNAYSLITLITHVNHMSFYSRKIKKQPMVLKYSLPISIIIPQYFTKASHLITRLTCHY